MSLEHPLFPAVPERYEIHDNLTTIFLKAAGGRVPKHLFLMVRVIGWGIKWFRGWPFITYSLSESAIFNNSAKWRGGCNVHARQLKVF